MVVYKDFERIVKIASAMRKMQVVGDKKFTEEKIRPILQDNFLEVFKSEGGNIGMPFPRKKEGGKPWEKFRKYNLPSEFQRWQLGIYTGGTSYSVINFTKTHNADTKLTTGKGMIKMSIKHNVYVNVTFGLSKESVERINKAVFTRVEDILKNMDGK